MKKILSALAAVALTATTAFAAGELIPAGGVYYPTDAINDGCITAQFEDSIAVPSATVTINSVAHNASVKSVGFTGKVYRVAVDSILNGSAAGTAFTLNVGGLSGNYTYQPTFPLTSVVPAADSALSEKTATIRFNFNTSVNYNGVAIKSGEKVDTIPGAGAGQNIDVALLESYWGTPVNGVNHISVTLLNVTVDGVSISNIAGNPGCIGANYTLQEATEQATYLGVEEDPYWWLAQDLFGYTVSFKYNKEVAITGATATVVLRDEIGTILENDTIAPATNMAAVEAGEEDTPNGIYAGWNMWNTEYLVTIPIPVYDYDATEFTTMTVSLNGIVASMSPVSATYDSSFPEEEMARKNKRNNEAGLDLNVVEEGTFDVYSISGSIVLHNANYDSLKKLDKGIYMANGKKFIVR